MKNPHSKKRIIIEFDKAGFTLMDDKRATDGEALMALSNSLTLVAGQVAREHDCKDPDCHIKEIAQQLLAAVASVYNLHNHGH